MKCLWRLLYAYKFDFGFIPLFLFLFFMTTLPLQ